jgi:hypothetical protein
VIILLILDGNKKSRQLDIDHVETFATLTLKRNEKLKLIAEYEDNIAKIGNGDEKQDEEEDELEAYMSVINNTVKKDEKTKAIKLLAETKTVLFGLTIYRNCSRLKR